MKTKTTSLCITLLLASQIGFAETPKKIGIIVPMTHEAMTEITQGFETSIQKEYKGPVEFKVMNSQGDANIQHASIQELRDEGYDIIAPIGTDATAMSVSMVKHQPIVSLASDLSDADRKKLSSCNVAVVHDEVSNAQELSFIHRVYPNLKTIVLFHSASDKIFPEVEDAKKAANALGITLKPIMVQSLPDLQTASANLPKDAQGIFVLKDSLIVSGIAQLAHVAEERKIPLISSDDGSVQNGAGFALGVHESQIGIDGGHLAAEILNGKNPCELPIVEMKKLTVFLNPDAMQKSGQSLDSVKKAAKALGYPIEMERANSK